MPRKKHPVVAIRLAATMLGMNYEEMEAFLQSSEGMEKFQVRFLNIEGEFFDEYEENILQREYLSGLRQSILWDMSTPVLYRNEVEKFKATKNPSFEAELAEARKRVEELERENADLRSRVCIGKGYMVFVCEERRKGTLDDDIAVKLSEKFGLSQAARESLLDTESAAVTTDALRKRSQRRPDKA